MKKDYIFLGVSGPVADFLGIDINLVRLLFVITGAFPLYLLLSFLLNHKAKNQ
ncbi:PspC domain-containing protein [Enterococcus saccharolyticus]|uniref:PspC domain-containing protein n=1 Tax=Enterococcus saccharolyticus TaxID=41997 RepID=UPI001E5017F8|nr:PspC domain-containing protein [Enterococcus saccharolyticus]MCD5003481.1 PspC domain-containing protein [Enterococcus saccharolyticus]